MSATVDLPESKPGFVVHLDNFDGPFDLLLSLISQHRMEITEVALAKVTDDFLATLSAAHAWDLSEASEFLVVAATLLDLKAARLLPQGDVEDAEDLAMLEARDLLFARLLQYRAFKTIATSLDELLSGPRRHPRDVPLEPHFAMLLPELVWSVTPDQLAGLAANVLSGPTVPPGVSITHLHNPAVSVREQAVLLATRLQREGALSFRSIVSDAGHVTMVVARFLALLELFRESVVAFEQVRSLGELTVRWTGGQHDTEISVSDEFDQELSGPDE